MTPITNQQKRWVEQVCEDLEITVIWKPFRVPLRGPEGQLPLGHWPGGDAIYIDGERAGIYTVLHEIGHVLCGHMCCREHCEYAAHGAALALARAYGFTLDPKDVDAIRAYAGRSADAACPEVSRNGGRPGADDPGNIETGQEGNPMPNEFSCEHCGKSERRQASRQCNHCQGAMCSACTERHDELDACPVDPTLAAATDGPDQPAADKAQAQRYLDACAEIKRRGLQEFLDFLCEGARVGGRRVRLMQRPDQSSSDWPWMPVNPEHLGEALLAAYFEIDLDAVERHRRRLLAAATNGQLRC